jgi:hypothetical protein
LEVVHQVAILTVDTLVTITKDIVLREQAEQAATFMDTEVVMDVLV